MINNILSIEANWYTDANYSSQSENTKQMTYTKWRSLFLT